MISNYKNKGLVWVDLVSPQEEEVLYVLDEYRIPENIRQEISSPSKEYNTFIENDTLFSIIKLSQDESEKNTNKVIFIKNRDYVITIHDQPMDFVEQFSRELELDMVVESESRIYNQELLFANLIRKMLTEMHDKVLTKDINISSLKRKVSGFEKKYKISFILNLVLLITLILTIVL
jgi:Mg2+ and Co2+ transporter CorA